MKDYLNKIIAARTAQVEELRKAIKDSQSADEVRALGSTLDAVLAELQEAKDKLAEEEAAPAEENAERKFNPLASYGTEKRDDNIEKRLNFAKYVTRANAITNTTGAAEAIPENLIPEIISTIENYGMVLPLINKTNYKVGQTIPLDGVKPTATWVAEGATSDSQAKDLAGTISFNAYKLRCEIRWTQEVNVQTLPIFEATFVKQVGEAMAKAIEAKVVSADDGSDCPTGILYRSSGSDAAVNILKLATGHFDYKALCDAEALLPQQYEGGAKWFMSKKTFMTIYSLIDSNGQPIGRINYGIDGKPERVLLGREVVVNPYVDDYVETEATADKVVAFLFNPADYTLNTSYDLGIKRAEDWDTEDIKIKAVMSVDGKVLDRNSIVKVVKKYN